MQLRPISELLEDGDDAVTSEEVYEVLRHLQDPEHPDLSLEQLKVIQLGKIWVEDKRILVHFTPTVPGCSVATLIGLTVKAKLLRSMPKRFKIDVEVTPGSHNQEDATNKQLHDKERVAAAIENPALRKLINRGIAGTDHVHLTSVLA